MDHPRATTLRAAAPHENLPQQCADQLTKQHGDVVLASVLANWDRLDHLEPGAKFEALVQTANLAKIFSDICQARARDFDVFSALEYDSQWDQPPATAHRAGSMLGEDRSSGGGSSSPEPVDVSPKRGRKRRRAPAKSRSSKAHRRKSKTRTEHGERAPKKAKCQQKWTPKQNRIVCERIEQTYWGVYEGELAATKVYRDLARDTRRTPSAVKNRVRELGVNYMNPNPNTQAGRKLEAKIIAAGYREQLAESRVRINKFKETFKETTHHSHANGDEKPSHVDVDSDGDETELQVVQAPKAALRPPSPPTKENGGQKPSAEEGAARPPPRISFVEYDRDGTVG